MSAALDPGSGGTVADLLAAQHACTVRFSDTVLGGYYAFGQVAQSRAALDWRFVQLGRLASGFKSSIYTPSSGLTPTGFVARMISQQGCKDVMLYLAGGGYDGQSAINIGMGTGKRGVVHQDVTLAQLRGLMTSQHGVNFELVIDAAHASGFQSLSGLANVLLVGNARVSVHLSPRGERERPPGHQRRQPVSHPPADRPAGVRDRSDGQQLGRGRADAVARQLGQASVGSRVRAGARVRAGRGRGLRHELGRRPAADREVPRLHRWAAGDSDGYR